jgi:hypothetical protein
MVFDAMIHSGAWHHINPFMDEMGVCIARRDKGWRFQGCYNLCRVIIAAQRMYLDIQYPYDERNICSSLETYLEWQDCHHSVSIRPTTLQGFVLKMSEMATRGEDVIVFTRTHLVLESARRVFKRGPFPRSMATVKAFFIFSCNQRLRQIFLRADANTGLCCGC